MRFNTLTPASTSASPSLGLAADTQSLNALKAEAGLTTPESIRETAKQFESLFMRELIKSMREATTRSGLLDSPGENLGTDLLDQQLALQMSGQPGGLSELIAQQLSRQSGVPLPPPAGTTSGYTPTTQLGASRMTAAEPRSSSTEFAAVKPRRQPSESQVNFVRQHTDIAGRIEQETGIPAHFMLGQAGHETGWGRHQIKMKGGAPSFNLFGIKAGANWKGKVAEVTTTEYVNGVAQKRVARFRAYDSYEDSFRDYARLISESPRYAKARAQTNSAYAFASGLQRAGYATDPDYAAKLSRAINTTLHLRRVQT